MDLVAGILHKLRYLLASDWCDSYIGGRSTSPGDERLHVSAVGNRTIETLVLAENAATGSTAVDQKSRGRSFWQQTWPRRPDGIGLSSVQPSALDDKGQKAGFLPSRAGLGCAAILGLSSILSY